MKSVTVEQMREMDRRAVSDYGIPSLLLMEQAGKGVADAILLLLSHQPRTTTVVIFAGGGNNAGDAFVAARYLHKHRVPMVIYHLSDPSRFTGDAAVNYAITQKLGIPPRPVEQFKSDLTSRFHGVPLVILDAMLGTGFKGPMREPVAGTISLINRLHKFHSAKSFVMAVDIPSGLDGDNGPAGGESIHANFTVTFACAKAGLLKPESRGTTGKIQIVDIGIPDELFEAVTKKKA